jgi:hypothetical protein
MLEKPVKAIQSHGQHRTQQGKQNEKKNRLDYGCLRDMFFQQKASRKKSNLAAILD